MKSAKRFVYTKNRKSPLKPNKCIHMNTTNVNNDVADVNFQIDYENADTNTDDSFYPPLIQSEPWSRKVFYRDNFDYHEDGKIASKVLEISYVPPKKKIKIKPYGPIGKDGELQFPKPRTPAELEKDRILKEKEIERKKKLEMKGFVPLVDLLNGDYFKRKQEEKRLKELRIEKNKIKKMQLIEMEREKERKKLIQLQAGLPHDPEEQIQTLTMQIVTECLGPIDRDEIDRIQYYLNSIALNKILSPYPMRLYKKIKNGLSNKLRKNLTSSVNKKLAMALEKDILNGYVLSMKESTLRDILKDPYERERLNIKYFPANWPTMTIRAPMSWHTSFVLAKQRLGYYFFQGNDIVIELEKLWNQKYTKLFICNIDDMQTASSFPLYCDTFEERLIELCDKSRTMILKEWMYDVADIMVRLQNSWGCYAPKKVSDKTFRVEAFFDTVCGIMSIQLRSLVIKSLQHFSDEFAKYQDGNNFGDVYEDFILNRRPLLSIKARPREQSEAICFSPTFDEVRLFINSWLLKIVDVNKNIPRIETLLFPEFSDNKMYLFSVNENEEFVQTIINKTINYFNENQIGPLTYLLNYECYKFILNGDAMTNLEKMYKQEPFPLMEDFSRQITYYEGLYNTITFLRRHVPLNMIMLDCCDINDHMWNTVAELKENIINYFILKNRELNKEICLVYQVMSQRSSEMPETTAQLVELLNYIVECRDKTTFELKNKAKITASNVLFLMKHAVLTDEDIALNSRVFVWPADMETVIESSYKTLTTKRNMAEDSLKNRKSVFEERLKRHERLLDSFRKLDPPLVNMELMKDYVVKIDEINNKITEDNVEATNINEEEALLDQEVSVFTILISMLTSVDPFHKLWHTSLDFHIGYEKWYYGPFAGLNADEIKDIVEEQWKLLHKLSKQLFDYPGAKSVAYLVRARVDKFKLLVPVLQAICNEGLQGHHWEKISELVGKPIILRPESSLSEIIELGVHEYIDKLQEISSAASKEFALEKSLMKMKDEWAGVKFDCVLYRETGVSILNSVDDIQLMLDDHILKSQTMRGSPYVKPFEAEMQAWEEKLISMQDILDQWLQVQSVWMYLEPIFSSEDIMRQMPTEARNFKEVDKQWRSIMNATSNNPEVLEATGYPDLLTSLKSSNDFLSGIQRSLNDYLEKKRLFFPRFFFLSNDELLEILSETKDPMRVQPHLKKCFEGIYTLKFNDQEEITGMVSAEDEVVTLANIINPEEAKGMVERWLSQLEEQMTVSLRDICIESTSSYGSSIRTEWILKWPGQIVQLGNCIQFTADVTEAIENQTIETYLDKCNTQIQDIVRLTQSDLQISHRITIEALIVMDVHGRDIVQNLLKSNIQKVTDFKWISQFRYYWIDNAVTCSMITTNIAYAFEYLGNTGRLVATPLTDRCYRTLMGALKLNLGGAPEGPAGTGKTETCKDLAKAVAKKCVVFNCTESLDYKALGKFFKGLAQSGAWACFDEFNRIELEVLSVISQQILSIQLAIMGKVKRFMFEGTEILLNPTCTCFVTMNPGYAGRQELPDNLKVLFRTVAMMVPDYAMIGEITLYSNGFTNAGPLAEKIVQVYKLCSEQLSAQNHYDYGMRAVKSVLIASGALKKKYPYQNEEELVLKAIIDVNLPKFLSEDIPLFTGIYMDLFPDAVIPEPNRDDLKRHISEELEQRNLCETPWFMGKILQIYEMMLVRHGLMIVGDPMSGKTSAYQTLAQALHRLNVQKPPSNHKEYVAIYKIINPKSITMGQLYGCFDIASHEWSDGVIAMTFREFASSATKERKWIVFDGPVDAVWIENLNTVLDDNKKLCLTSGEIIQMSNRMNLIFEPADLDHASPATVSRCGMIFFESKELGWNPLLVSFNKMFIQKVPQDQYDIIQELIEWLIQPILNYINEMCTHFITTNEQHLFNSFTRLFFAFLEGEEQISIVWIQCIFLLSLIWGLCSTIKGDSRKKFDAFFRKLIEGSISEYPKPKSFKLSKNQLFPERGTIFDFMYDKKNGGTWMNWVDIEKPTSFNANVKISDMIIPTNENGYLIYFLQLMVSQNVPILLLGPTGTGKSSLIKNFFLSLPRNKFITNTIIFSARTSANQTQDIIMSKLDRRRKGVYGPAMGKQCILFIDDLSMPQKKEYGSQPPLELLRHWIDHGHWYDTKDSTKQELVDVQFLAAMLPPGGGSNLVTNRLIRHLNVFSVDSFGDETLSKIFGFIMDLHFTRGFSESLVRMSKAIVSATLEVYKKAMFEFLPTPVKSHYTFNLRDFSKVIRGILLIPSTHMKSEEKLITLWVHEIYRVFNDRLVDDDDRLKLFDIVNNSVTKNFHTKLSKVINNYVPDGESLNHDHISNIFFGNYMEPDAHPKIYDQIFDVDSMIEKMDYYLDEYNLINSPPLQMVMFRYALEHISRACRALLQDDGHLLLMGVGGSGRRSIVKLAASILEMDCFQIQISQMYTRVEWNEDLKRLLMRTGISGKPTVFLFSDDQIKYEDMVEDINMIMNAGDKPYLYAVEDKTEITDKMLNIARESGQTETTPFALFNLFIERVKSNLRIVFVMSPIGESFKNRLRMFPSLVNCCTLDWYTPWPAEALEKVGYMYLNNINMGPEDVKKSCINMCKFFHTTVKDYSIRFFNEQKRKNYVTPTTYLELIKMFKVFYKLKVDQITLARNRYISGLERLEFAAGQVISMQNQLTELHPQLVETSDTTEKLMIKIEQDTMVVEAQKEIVGADEALANEAAAAAQAIKDDCEGDLAEAVPALEAAVTALNTLKPADITLVKSMKNPPGGVKLVMEAVCVMKGVKSDRKANALGVIIEDFWGPSLKLLGDMKFLESLKTYDKDNINPTIMKRIRDKYIPDRDFNPDVITKVSTACEGLCKWVRAMEVYDRVIKVVAPKKAALAVAEGELQAQMFTLNEKRAQLQGVLDKLQALNDEFAEYTRKKKGLEDEISVCSEKLERAEKLIGGLGGEKSRWSELADNLQQLLSNVIGDVLLSAGFVAYLGAFTKNYRNELIHLWNENCIKNGVPCSMNFSLISTLGDPVDIREWNISGLPVDNFSVENGIIVNKCRRWPLMIDPQDQATKWIKNIERSNDLMLVKLSDANYLETLEKAIQLGRPVIIENVLETLDAVLNPVLLMNFNKVGGKNCIQLTENSVEYNDNFRLYVTTKLRNPHYLPETSVKVTLVNFTITPEGLQDQLLGIVVSKDKPELEKKKNELIIEGSINKRTLKEIEDQILLVLSSEGNILEDESANKILSSSKALSEEIQEKQKIAAITETEIDDARSQYIPVSIHSCTLFFCISNLANLDPMYQYSLSWFINLYNQSIINAPQSEVINHRLEELKDYFTKSIYKNVCRCLFEKDKLIFSFLLTLGILRSRDKIDEDTLSYLLTGGITFENPYVNPAPEWLSDKSWSEIVKASELSGLHELKTEFEIHLNEWKVFYEHSNPHTTSFPNPFENVNGLIKLVLLRCIRPDKLVPVVRQFIEMNLGKFYTEPPQFNLQESYNDSNCCIPLILILSSGSDPMNTLVKFASEKNKTDVKYISLGQGQGPIATKMINDSLERGGWIVLQNCHLMQSWMPELDRICSEIITPEIAHPEFRCWLTSYPSEGFPVSILQNGVKMVNERPKGLKNILHRSYTSDPISNDEFYSNSPQPYVWQRLLFSLCFFHAIIDARKDFGPLGWNIPYEFNESDLRISATQLQMFLTEYDEIPLEAISYLTGECNYGGRVTDDNDRRLLSSLLSIFYNEEIISNAEYSFSPSGMYKFPNKLDRDSVIDYINELPSIELPEVFGLHENAEITKNNQETITFLSGVLTTQTHLSTMDSLQDDSEQQILNLIDDINQRLPDYFNVELIVEKYPITYENSMNTVLKQELISYNRLLHVIKDTLNDVHLAIRGLAIMSVELEECFKSLMMGVVPNLWKSRSYPSLKPLGSYISDLLMRLNFFQDWIDNGTPPVYWFSGFYFTQSFLTGVLQNYSRKYKIAIDELHFEFEITNFETEPNINPSFGAYSKGLYLEGARWNRDLEILDESNPKILYDMLPILWLKPSKKADFDPPLCYYCPVYKTILRRGVLATTGHSSNFVTTINIKSNMPEIHWINRGVACITQLDD